MRGDIREDLLLLKRTGELWISWHAGRRRTALNGNDKTFIFEILIFSTLFLLSHRKSQHTTTFIPCYPLC